MSYSVIKIYYYWVNAPAPALTCFAQARSAGRPFIVSTSHKTKGASPKNLHDLHPDVNRIVSELRLRFDAESIAGMN